MGARAFLVDNTVKWMFNMSTAMIVLFVDFLSIMR